MAVHGAKLSKPSVSFSSCPLFVMGSFGEGAAAATSFAIIFEKLKRMRKRLHKGQLSCWVKHIALGICGKAMVERQKGTWICSENFCLRMMRLLNVFM